MTDQHAFSGPVVANARRRAELMRALRAWFDAREFLEVDTGTLVDEPGQEPTLDPLRTDDGRYLITSPELRMKRLLAAGYGKIYQLGKTFRQGLGERSDLHHPEFTLLEWYRPAGDGDGIVGIDGLDALIHDLESLLPACGRAVTGGRVSATPFERLTVTEAFARHADVDLTPLLDRDADGFRAGARRAGVATSPDESPESLFFRVLLDRIEPQLGRGAPTVLLGYPASMAALARLDDDDPRVARRFELYVEGVELANAFDELTDPAEQRRRIDEERRAKRAEGRDPGPFPEKFLAALERGMPRAAGIALGVDRLLMLLVGAERIDDVLLFPDPPAGGTSGEGASA